MLLVILFTGCTASTTVMTPTATSTTLPTETALIPPTLFLSPTPVTLPPGQEIIFEESGTNKFTGTAYGTGKTAIILANMSIGGPKQWDPFVASVDKQKFTTITFSYRNINDVNPDMDLVLHWIRQEGFARVICIGASLGTKACTAIMGEPEIVGIALIAGSVHHASVAEAAYPKLFIAGALDVWAFDIQNGYEQASEPKTLVLFENSRVHGTDLFHSKDGEPFLNLLIDFVNRLANS